MAQAAERKVAALETRCAAAVSEAAAASSGVISVQAGLQSLEGRLEQARSALHLLRLCVFTVSFGQHAAESPFGRSDHHLQVARGAAAGVRAVDGKVEAMSVRRPVGSRYSPIFFAAPLFLRFAAAAKRNVPHLLYYCGKCRLRSAPRRRRRR